MPVIMGLRYKDENDVARGSWFPEAKRIGERTVAYTHNDLIEVLEFFMLAR